MLAVPYLPSANERFDAAHDVRKAQPHYPDQHCHRRRLRGVGYLRDPLRELARLQVDHRVPAAATAHRPS